MLRLSTLRGILTLVVLGLFLCIAAVSTLTEEAAAPGNIILIVSEFPEKEAREFAKSLRTRAAHEKAFSSTEFRAVSTFGDETALKQAIAARGPEPAYPVICMDCRSAEMSAGIGCRPLVAVVPSKNLLSTKTLAYLGVNSKNCIIETAIRPRDVVGMLDSLDRPPAHLGVVHTPEAAANEGFYQETRVLLEKRLPGKVRMMECALSPAACQNSNAVKRSVEECSASMPRGSLLVVLPGQNSLKFPFVFREISQKQGFGLISVGEFPTDGTVGHIAYSPDTLAALCMERMCLAPGTENREEHADGACGPDWHWDATALRDLGYRAKADSSATGRE